MQPHDNNQRPTESDTDRRRHDQFAAIKDQVELAIKEIINLYHGSLHIAEHGKSVNMKATLTGSGGIKA